MIHYIADLANTNDADDIFDYDFVESLLENGADISCKDPNGQTVFHEVARSWNTDVAKFLVEHGNYVFKLSFQSRKHFIAVPDVISDVM